MTADDGSASAAYDPFAYVPDRIDAVTASGLVQLHKPLNARNRATLRSVLLKEQGALLWALVEEGTVDVDLTAGGSQ